MKVEVEKKTVEAVGGATITLDNREVRMLLDLVGNISGGGEMRTFTNNLYRKLGVGLSYKDSKDPFSSGAVLSPNYKPKGF